MKKITVILVGLICGFQAYAQDTIQAKFSVVNVCDGEEAVFTNTSKVPVKFGNANYYWSFGDGTTSTAQFPKHTYTLTNASIEERFQVKLVVQSKSIPSEKDSMIDFISVYPNPDASFTWDVDNKGNTQDVIIVSQGTIDADNFYQWNLAGVLKSNDITPTFVHDDVKPYLDGKDYNFSLLVRTTDNCSSTYTTKFNYNPLSTEDVFVKQNIIYPNPTSGSIQLTEAMSDVVIRNVAGQVVYDQTESVQTIELNEPSGVYYLSAKLNGQSVSQKLLIQ